MMVLTDNNGDRPAAPSPGPRRPCRGTRTPRTEASLYHYDYYYHHCHYHIISIILMIIIIIIS